MKKRLLEFLLVLLPGVLLPWTGLCGVIRTDITLTSRPALEGGWDLTALIENRGDAEAYGLRAFLFVDGWAEVFSDLGDSPPGGTVRLNARYVPGKGLPGRYTGMVRLHFEEKSGRAHRVFHPFSLKQGEGWAPSAGLDVAVSAPVFHPRAFWRPDPQIEVRVGNPHAGPLKAHVQVFLPEGITTPSPYVMEPLQPGTTTLLTFPLALAEPLPREKRFHVVAWFEKERMHMSRYLEGRVKVEEGPVLMKVYGAAALIVLSVVLLAMLVRRRRGPGHADRDRP